MEKLTEQTRNKLKRISRKRLEDYCDDFFGITKKNQHHLFAREELEWHFMWSIDFKWAKEEKIRFLQTMISDLKNETKNYRKFYANKRNIK